MIAGLRERYGIVVRPIAAEATSLAWPSNETGRYDPIPGEDVCTGLLELVIHLQQERRAGV